MMQTVSHKLYAKHLAQNCDITTGNVYSNAQASSCVRAWNDTSPDYKGNPRKPGDLQEFDLKPLNLPEHIKANVRRLLKEKEGAVYLLRHYGRSKKRIWHGFIITAHHDNDILYVNTASNFKSQEIVEYAVEAIGWQAVRYNSARAKHAHASTTTQTETN